ncbi:MAG: hypothetical protein KDK90_12685 [Leptospiraceae bacterium]|nr:hypothetical protein [Leptospiraceae bacterium]
MIKIFIAFFSIILFSNCYQTEINDVKHENDLLMGIAIYEYSLLEKTYAEFELNGVAYTALSGAVTEKFVGNQLKANWYNATFKRANSTGGYYSIIPGYNNAENYFYVIRGLVNYSAAGCPTTGAATSVPYTSCASGTYGGELRQDWTTIEYYRYRYTDDKSDGYFYLCVEAGPYDSLAKVQADTTHAVFNYSDVSNEISSSSTCVDIDGSNSGSSNVASGRSGQNIFDGFWFQLKKIK